MSVSSVARAGDVATVRACITAASIGAVAMVLADMVHEALGHGTACWLTGDRMRSLSTVALQTAEPNRFVSAGGTTANIIIGALALLWFARLKSMTPAAWFLWLFGIFNLLNSGYLVASAVLNTSDWSKVIEGQSPLWLWRFLMGLAGVVLYVLSVRWGAAMLIRRVESGQIGLVDLPRVTVPAYLAAGALLTLASIFNPIGRQLIVGSGIGPSFGLNAGLLFIPGIVKDHARNCPSITKPLPLSFSWLILALVSAGCFVAVLGPGIQLSKL